MENDSMSKIGLVIQARMSSKRLPGKVLLELNGKALLLHIVERLKELNKNYKRIVITSSLKKDDKIERFCKKNKLSFFRGSEEDVLDRYYKTAKKFELKHTVRLTGDNPLVDISNLKFLINKHLETGADYSSNKAEVGSCLPMGTGAEIFSFPALERSWREGKKPNHREHVNEYILENKEKFNTLFLTATKKDLTKCKNLRLTIDTKEDFEFVERILGLLEKHKLKSTLENICKLTEAGEI